VKFKTKDELSISQLWELPKTEELELNPAFQNKQLDAMIKQTVYFEPQLVHHRKPFSPDEERSA
jgi:hypothetical protein